MIEPIRYCGDTAAGQRHRTARHRAAADRAARCLDASAASRAPALVPAAALAPPRPSTGPVQPLAGGGGEAGFTILEALVASALVAVTIVGGTVVFGQQKHTAATVTAADSLRDDVAAVDVDLHALQAYDPAVQSKIAGAGQQLWTLPAGGSDAPVVLQAQAAGGGVSVVARSGAQAASVIAPLAQPKPVPQ